MYCVFMYCVFTSLSHGGFLYFWKEEAVNQLSNDLFSLKLSAPENFDKNN